MRDLSRLLSPKSIAIFGGSWAANVISQLKKSGYSGAIWPVHPTRTEIGGLTCYSNIQDLPSAPDASFIGVNRDATLSLIDQLRVAGAGGAVCFASGFSESESQESGGSERQQRLVKAAGEMPVLGPNCYGFINYLDNVPIWPDQHGGITIDSGIGIVAQSSNIAINMTMQQRVVPIAFMATAGNQAQTGISDIASVLIDDARITAIGLYLEGFGDIRALEALAAKARAANKPIVALKIGRTDKARAATITHTASLAGDAAASSALLARLGIIEVRSIAVFLETLKLMHTFGPLTGNAVCSISCSGGEASLMADLAADTQIDFRDFTAPRQKTLRNELGPLVTIANPFDYHTFIWGDVPRMTSVFATVMQDQFDVCVFVLDMPRSEHCDPSGHTCAVEAIIAAKEKTGARVAVLASLPENLSEHDCQKFNASGIAVLHGMEEGIHAIHASVRPNQSHPRSESPVLLTATPTQNTTTLNETQSKTALAEFGLSIPASAQATTPNALQKEAAALKYPVALKGLGIAHKSEHGAVILNITTPEQLARAAETMTSTATGYLAEEMITDPIAELFIGVTRDETGMLLLTLGAGGTLIELIDDTENLLLPTTRTDIENAIRALKIAKLLTGYRGAPPADMNAIVDAVEAVCAYAVNNSQSIIELDINPLIARQHDAIAVDALICLSNPHVEPA